MFDDRRKYKIHWEVTDLCNLKCPMCPRTDIRNRCRPIREIRHTQFFLNDVKKLLPSAFLRRVKRIDFCGNFGDPCMARDFYEICQWLMNGHDFTVMVSTNGSMRRPDWWRRLGRLFARGNSWLELHVDGLRDTNHLYRIGARWDDIMANAAAFIDGGGRAEWHFILFKHNQHQVEQAREIAARMRFSSFVTIETCRFPEGGQLAYMHPDGDRRTLEQASVRLPKQPKTTRKASCRTSGRPAAFEAGAIACKSAQENRFFIDAAGYLAPCCWIADRNPQRPGEMLRAVAAAGKDIEQFNIRSRPIEEILRDDLFSKQFPELWRADALYNCRKKCGRRHRHVKIKQKL